MKYNLSQKQKKIPVRVLKTIVTGKHHFNAIYPDNTFYLKFIALVFQNRRSCIFRRLLNPSEELSPSHYPATSGESDVFPAGRLC